jgi:hypothetical protein
MEILESLITQTRLITAAKGEEPDLASLVSLEISAMDQAIEEVSERDGQSYLTRDLFHGPGHRGGE